MIQHHYVQDMKKFPIICNWKMNGSIKKLQETLTSIKLEQKHNIELIIAPPIIYTNYVKNLVDTMNYDIKIAIQNIHHKESGAFTGYTSAQMASEMGASHAIIGHSECRKYMLDTNLGIKEKVGLSLQNNMIAAICIGSSMTEKYDKNQIINECKECISVNSNANNTLISLEPGWAIGSNSSADPEFILSVCQDIKSILPSFKVLYGGSVNETNVEQIITKGKIDGLLLGRAGMEIEKLSSIVEIASKSL